MDLSWNYNLCYVTKLGLLQICFILRIECEIKKKLYSGILSQGHVKNCCCLINLILTNSFLIHNMAASKRASLSSLVPSELITGLGSGLALWISTSFGDLDFNIFHVYTCIYGKECRLASWRCSSSISVYRLKNLTGTLAKLAKKSLIFVVRFSDQPCERTLSHLSPIVLILDSSGRRIFAYWKQNILRDRQPDICRKIIIFSLPQKRGVINYSQR